MNNPNIVAAAMIGGTALSLIAAALWRISIALDVLAGIK